MAELFKDRMDLLPNPNLPIISGYHGIHPIASTVIQQLSQDLLNVTRRAGTAEDLQKFDHRYRDFVPWVQEALYQALVSGGDRWLALDYGDPVTEWSSPAPNVVPTPHEIYSQSPTIGMVQGVGSTDDTPLDPSRWIQFRNPYQFNLGRYLHQELQQYDRLARGISERVLTGGSLQFGISGLWQKVMAGGQALTNLTTRLRQTKDAISSPGGVLAYDLDGEKPELSSRAYHAEHEAASIWENRITAITGIPAFVIWGKAEGDQYSTTTSLRLYSQRLAGMASRYLVPSLNLLAQFLSPDDTDPPYFTLVDLYPETLSEQAERLEKVVSALSSLVGIGALTALEVRSTVATAFDVQLDPTTPTIGGGTP